MQQAPLQDHEVVVTREMLKEWFDGCYEPGEDGGQYSWDSERGRRDFEKLRGKEIMFVRHCESTYQTAKFGREAIQCNPKYKDADLTEMGKVQAADLGARLAMGGFRPDLIVSSPLTRCLETAALVFSAAFLPHAAERPQIKVLSKLLPEIVHSWGDTGRSLDAVIDGGVEPLSGAMRDPKPHLEAFRGAESRSRFQKDDCNKKGQLRGCRWQKKAGGEFGKPREDRAHAKLRCALVWRWLSENRPERRIAIVTHSKLIKAREDIHLAGPGIDEIQNGEFVRVTVA